MCIRKLLRCTSECLRSQKNVDTLSSTLGKLAILMEFDLSYPNFHICDLSFHAVSRDLRGCTSLLGELSKRGFIGRHDSVESVHKHMATSHQVTRAMEWFRIQPRNAASLRGDSASESRWCSLGCAAEVRALMACCHDGRRWSWT